MREFTFLKTIIASSIILFILKLYYAFYKWCEIKIIKKENLIIKDIDYFQDNYTKFKKNLKTKYEFVE